MKHTVQILTLVCALAMLVCMPNNASAQIAADVRISEIYGGGGNSGSTWTNDFIELYNPTGHAIDMTGWSVQYASAAGTSWQVTGLTGNIPSHGFYLVAEAAGAGGTTPLPTPDVLGVIAMAAGSGKVALVNTTTALTGSDPHLDASVLDFVGYGTANAFEGGGPTGTVLLATTSAERKAKFNSTIDSMQTAGADTLAGNAWDTNNNSADFVVRGAILGHIPNPQNSASPLETPPVIGNISPIISSITRTIFVAEVGGIDSIKANIADLDGTIAGAKLNIRVNGGTVDSSIAMVLTVAPQYVGVIPAGKHTVAGNLVEYWISATDNLGAYSTTSSTPGGYFVGNTPVSSVKAYAPTAVNGYAARFNGTLNVTTNLFTNGQGFIQDATGGMQIFKAGGITQLNEGQNAKVTGSLVPFANAFELQDPNFAIDTAGLGTSPVTVTTITLPLTQTPQSLNEGRLVKIVGMSTASVGTFAAASNYIYSEPDLDTITVRVESNGAANNLVGRTIPGTPIDAYGILSYNSTNLRLKPRKDTDMGITGGDGTGTAVITPTFRFSGVSAVAETLTIAGNGVNTLEGVSVTIPATWTWDGTSKTVSGLGFAGNTTVVSGSGTVLDPWVITVTGVAVNNTNTGIIRVFNLNTPASLGSTSWTTKTRILAGTLSNVVSQPTVNIVSGFEIIASGRWSNPATWSNNTVPTASDNVTMTTLGVVDTIDIPGAVCNNLTLTGTGSASNSGPLLLFEASGTRQLTVNGAISISGGSGGGTGDRGGRPKLTSNGNTSATLIVKKNVFSGSSNSSGDAGLNMNEGTVKFTGTTSDTLQLGAGVRVGNLEIGDGTNAKTMSTTVLSTGHLLALRSLTVKQGSTFWIGTLDNLNVLSVGSVGSATIPTLNGGITVETGASLRTIESSAGIVSATINVFGGGVTNNGTLNLTNTTNRFNLNIDTTSQSIGGTTAGTYADVTVGSTITLTLNRGMNINSAYKMTLNGTLAEAAGQPVIGKVQTTRTVNASSVETFGGIGLGMTTFATAPGSTVVTRVTGVASIGGSSTSILRYFDIVPTVNTGLGVTARYFYDNTELAGQTAATLQLWKSLNSGSTWTPDGGVVTVGLRQIELTGVNSFARWTASDATHPLNGATTTLSVPVLNSWNLVSLPVASPTGGNLVQQVYTTSATATAFYFNGSYQTTTTLAPGPGYWIKSTGATSQSITGGVIDSLTIPLIFTPSPWNIIGSISSAIDTSSARVTPSAPGLRGSSFFKYSAGYQATDSLKPGGGYWVKANFVGSFHLHTTGVPAAPSKGIAAGRSIEDLNVLTIQDANGGLQKLYFGEDGRNEIPVNMFAMPPAPPVGSFDARFVAEGGMMVQTHAAEVSDVIEMPIAIQSVAYPLTVSWKMNGSASTYELSDASGSHQVRGEGSIKINNSAVNHLTLKVTGGSTLPKEFALSQNYPNPFNPTTNIKYALPVDSKLTMEIYNILGQKVRTLLAGEQAAGYHSIEWNGKGNEGQQLASGVYFLQMSAAGANGKKFSELKKLMLMK